MKNIKSGKSEISRRKKRKRQMAARKRNSLINIYGKNCCYCGCETFTKQDVISKYKNCDIRFSPKFIIVRDKITKKEIRFKLCTIEHLLDVLHPDANKIENLRICCAGCNYEQARKPKLV